MKKNKFNATAPILSALLSLSVLESALAQGDQEFADLGECALSSGEVLLGCEIGYRTFGTLNADRSNVVLFPTWFTGSTQGLVDAGLIGPESLADSSAFYVIAVDAFGNGVSSSPSNSEHYSEDQFPDVSLEDMVDSQHRLLTEILGIQEVWAVVGISMGGMQTFQWMVSYPDFMEKAVSIIGTPKQTSYDLLVWNTQLAIIDAVKDLPNGDETAGRLISAVGNLSLWTPTHIVSTWTPEQFDEFFGQTEQGGVGFNPRNHSLQLNAMINHDITEDFDGSWDRVAEAARAQALVVVATEDHVVNPSTSLEFAAASGAQVLELEGPSCGHVDAVFCEHDRLKQTVTDFLSE